MLSSCCGKYLNLTIMLKQMSLLYHNTLTNVSASQIYLNAVTKSTLNRNAVTKSILSRNAVTKSILNRNAVTKSILNHNAVTNAYFTAILWQMPVV